MSKIPPQVYDKAIRAAMDHMRGQNRNIVRREAETIFNNSVNTMLKEWNAKIETRDQKISYSNNIPVGGQFRLITPWEDSKIN